MKKNKITGLLRRLASRNDDKTWVKSIVVGAGSACLVCFLGLPCFAAQKLVVAPLDAQAENYFAYPAVSEVIAADVARAFGSKIQAQYLEKPDYKKIRKEFGTPYLLTISSKADKRDPWEVALVGADAVFELETNAVLLDTSSGLVMWSRSYKKKFLAAQSYCQLENIRMYSKDIAAPDIAQNVTLRFFPKTIRTPGQNVEGGGVRYDGQKPKSKIDNDGFYGDMMFSL
jgi:hypothetical protein